MTATSQLPQERHYRWLALAKEKPPEWLAGFVESRTANWVVITENGSPVDRNRLSAYLDAAEDLPFWAFALAKSYLDDVGEWPVFGLNTEQALDAYEEHQDPVQAVQEILATVKPVWADLEVIYAGPERSA